MSLTDKASTFYSFLLSLPGVSKLEVQQSMSVLYVESSSLRETLLHLKKHEQTRFSSLLDLYAVDNLGDVKRFDIDYHVYSYWLKYRLVVRVQLEESSASVESVSDMFLAAAWLEREVWDMFGIIFYNNPDLRRILTDYGFEGHPLRKDFPVSGFVELRYDDGCKRIVYEPLEISQEYRSYFFKSPWTEL